MRYIVQKILFLVKIFFFFTTKIVVTVLFAQTYWRQHSHAPGLFSSLLWAFNLISFSVSFKPSICELYWSFISEYEGSTTLKNDLDRNGLGLCMGKEPNGQMTERKKEQKEVPHAPRVWLMCAECVFPVQSCCHMVEFLIMMEPVSCNSMPERSRPQE